MIRLKYLTGIAVIILIASCGDQKQNTLSSEEIAEGWELLFDGKTLDGWKDYNGNALTAPWFVENGTIQAKGTGADAHGYIVTEKVYENFELKWDWKIAEGGNSGILYHVVENPMFDVPYITGPEYQLIDNAGYEDLKEWQSTGADYAMYAPDAANTEIRPAGNWNSSRIVFDNGHVEHWLNGKKIVEFEAWTDDWFERKNNGKWGNASEYGLAHRGAICLQDHGSAAWFRNLKIREIPRKTREVALFNGVDLSGWEIVGTDQWYVKDEVLVCESGPDEEYGYLTTREYYDDFDLTLEFKQEADGNSGVFFRTFIQPGPTTYGWQVEVAPLGMDTGGIYESNGRGWLVQIPDEKENILKEKEWNLLRIRVVGDNVKTWLNGQEMADYSDAMIGKREGRIALQIHDGGGIKVLWKNLKLQTL